MDYEKIINTPEFKNLVKRKRIFSTPYIIFFFAPILHYLFSQDIQPYLKMGHRLDDLDMGVLIKHVRNGMGVYIHLYEQSEKLRYRC